MISYLKGKIILKKDKYIILNTGQIGYQVMLNEKSLTLLAEEQEVELFTHLHVREDAQELYGFLSLPELELFKNLIAISGVGPKSALAVLAVATVGDIIQAVLSEDPTLLQKVSGIGRKTAERIVLELKNKTAALAEKGLTAGSLSAPRDSDVIDALINLGYSQREVISAIKQVPPDITDPSERIKRALKMMGK